MKEKRAGICTMTTGFNYGTCLQAFAMKQTLKNLGFQSEIYRLAGSIIPDRDARRGKIIIITPALCSPSEKHSRFRTGSGAKIRNQPANVS